MMNRRTMKRAIAFFLLTVMVSNMLLPMTGWALTSGPTAPEATSFEPVDTTDMVNLSTGDFVYNIPLLEVPGPAGGYPISLSYHAGIQPGEDASWVGLGWTLNPGAISRTVNGYPDDQLGAIRTRRDYDHGGTRNTFSLGVGVPGLMYDLSISNDSNLGLGIGSSLTVGANLELKGTGANIGLNYTVGDNGYGDFFNNGSIGISTGNIGVRTNFKSVSLSVSAGVMGASISSDGLKPSMSVAGISAHQSNSNAGRITTSSWGISTPPIPIGPVTLTLGYNYLRYYSDETSNVNLLGSLHGLSSTGKNADTWAYDSYALIDPNVEDFIIKNADPEKTKGGSFPAYDNYNVMAQGLGGTIQPYVLKNGTLFRQNLKKSDGTYEIKYGQVNSSYNMAVPVNFRFKNDFSNVHTFDQTSMAYYNDQNIQFSEPVSNPTPTEGFNLNNRHLAGSKHIEYFTNIQIRDGVAKAKGFIDYKSNSSRETGKYNNDISNQVGGFMITNESGVTYHYALPVYAYFQSHKIFKTGKENQVFQQNSENHPYAYTWFLTAVTGPDYVNRNPSNDGTISKDDWGYWVKFDYSMKTDKYIWRNPDMGTHKDIDVGTEMYSYGQKELYYLDKVETASHVAVFNKSERLDARGVTGGVVGGYQPVNYSNCYTDPNCTPQPCTDPDPRACGEPCQICEGVTETAAKTSKLDNIMLLSRRDFETGGDLLSKSIRVISLNTDYSLAPGTANSFSDDDYTQKFGKLTLKSISFLGKGGADLTPPMSFEYAKNPTFSRDAYDMWGMYKSDYQANTNNYFSHLVTENSSINTDAWSLTAIHSSMGGVIRVYYESDSYNTPVAYKGPIANSKIMYRKPGSIDEVVIDFGNSGQMSAFSAQSQTHLSALFTYPYDNHAYNAGDCSTDQNNSCYGQSDANLKGFKFRIFDNDVLISEVGLSTITIKDINLFSFFDKLVMPTIKTPVSNNCQICEIWEVFTPHTPDFIECVITSDPNDILGGGIRVKNVSIYSVTGESRITKYSYTDDQFKTSGYTSYEPSSIIDSEIQMPSNAYYSSQVTKGDAEKAYKPKYQQYFTKLFRAVREIPSPGVLYKTVTVEEEILHAGETLPTKIPGKKVYEFQVFDENIVQRMGMTTSENPYAALCFAADGEPVACNPAPGGVNPVTCKDQYGHPIACGTQRSTQYTPMTLKDFSAWVGALKTVTTYGANNQVLEKVTNEYLHDEGSQPFENKLKTQFGNQGVVTQLFHENRYPAGIVYSRRDEYPLVAVGQTTVNYKTGITTHSQNLAFDFYTGKPTKVLNTDSYGNRFISESVPAYRIGPYSGMSQSQVSSGFAGMGLKVNNSNNRNMLTQEAANYTYRADANNNVIGIVSASAQTWSTTTRVLDANIQNTIWRQRSSFSFAGDDNVALLTDGLYPGANYSIFDGWVSNAATSGWQKNNEITLYDYYSHALEAKDINGNFAATKMSLDQTRVAATATDVGFYEFAFSGAEDIFNPNATYNEDNVVTYDGGVIHSLKSHTGQNSLQLSSGVAGFHASLTLPSERWRPYRASVWVHQSSAQGAQFYYQINDGNNTQPPVYLNLNVATAPKAGEWYLFEVTIPIPTNLNAEALYVDVGVRNNGAGQVWVDDFRVHPVQSAMMSYVYNGWGELSHILDHNNLYTEYRYDGAGRLISTHRETFATGAVKVAEIKYHFKGQLD